MKKSYFLIGGIFIILIAVILAFCCNERSVDSKILVTVNGVNITQEEAEQRKQMLQIMNKIYEIWIPEVKEDSDIDVSQFIYSTELKSVTNQLVRNEVVRQYLSQKGELLSYDEVRDDTDQTMSTMLDDDTYKTALESSLKLFQVDQDVFLMQYSSYVYDVCCVEHAKSLFEADDRYDKNSSQSLDNQFTTFIDSLIQDADIIWL